MRAITKLTLIALLTVGLLAAPLTLAGSRETGEANAAAGQARGEEHRANATDAADDADRGNASANATAQRAQMQAARASWRENATLVRESWQENATAIRDSCHAAELDHANATEEEQTAHAQCIKTGYASWREANMERLRTLRDAFLAFLGVRGHMGS